MSPYGTINEITLGHDCPQSETPDETNSGPMFQFKPNDAIERNTDVAMT
jgi:hypothetical protein